MNYLHRSRLLFNNEGTGIGTEGYPAQFKEKEKKCNEKIDAIYEKSYDASLYFDKPVREEVEKYINSARRVMLYSFLHVQIVNINNFEINKPGYVFNKGLFEEDKKKSLANRFDTLFDGKMITLEAQTRYPNHKEYWKEVDRRLERENKDLESNFSKLELIFKKQLTSKNF